MSSAAPTAAAAFSAPERAAEPAGAPDPLVLSDDEAEVVAAEAASAARVLDGPRRDDAARLADTAATGEVPPELLPALSEIASASLRSGRARRLYRAEGEKLLTSVLCRTPAGRELQGDLDGVNAALTALAGRRLEGVRVAMRRPGSYTLNLQCDQFGLTLGVTPDGVTVESVTA